MISRRTLKIAAFCAAVGLVAVGGWWLLADRLPELDDEEWPYIGYAEAQRKLAAALLQQGPSPIQHVMDAAA